MLRLDDGTLTCRFVPIQTRIAHEEAALRIQHALKQQAARKAGSNTNASQQPASQSGSSKKPN